jgi:L-threonylcarbamoyladenylate synthase
MGILPVYIFMPQVSLQALVAGVRSGQQLASFPTDTVPALAARPDCAGLIFAAKQRSETKPLILMGANITDLWEFVAGSEAERAQWQQVANQYFPGALTLVLPASDRLPPAMNPTDPTTIGIRVPDSAIARHILALTGPLATTSVNRSGDPPLQNMAEIEQQFPEVLTLFPSELAAIATIETPEPDVSTASDMSGSGIPSTVAKWTGNGWQILRQGRIKLAE